MIASLHKLRTPSPVQIRKHAAFVVRSATILRMPARALPPQPAAKPPPLRRPRRHETPLSPAEICHGVAHGLIRE